jgi:indolepyruvate ferredoxin oxidoreductase beta subunit
VPAQVDVVVASELLEAARMMERGFVTPQKTCLIASTSRVYTTLEKMQMGDGRFDSQRIMDLAQTLAQRAVLFDMAALTQAHHTVVSAIMFGALSGSGVLPWSREVCEHIIQSSGKGVSASLAGFDAAFLKASANGTAETAATPQTAKSDATPIATLPPAMQNMAALGMARCLDFQDAIYAQDYLNKLQALVNTLNPAAISAETEQALQTAARHLALWMCYEDVIRVADLKTRPERFERVRSEANASAHDVVRVVEHFKPGLDEVAAVLPQVLGQRLLSWSQNRQRKNLHMAMHIRSSSIWGYLMLRALARLRPWRRNSLRYAQEHATLHIWWQTMCAVLPRAPAFANVLAELPQVLKGYGDTQARGRLNYERLWQTHVQPALAGHISMQEAAQQLQKALQDTLADPEEKLNKSYQGKPVLWLKQNQST